MVRELLIISSLINTPLYETTQPHEINASDVGKDEAQCIRCRYTIDLIKGMAIVAGPFYIIDILKMAVRFILPE